MENEQFNKEARGQVTEKLITLKGVFEAPKQMEYMENMVAKIPPQTAAEYEGLDLYEKALKFWDIFHGEGANPDEKKLPTDQQAGSTTVIKKKKGGAKTPAKEYAPGSDIPEEAQAVFSKFVGEKALEAQYATAKATRITKALFAKPTGEELNALGLMPAAAIPTYKQSKADYWKDHLVGKDLPDSANVAKYNAWLAAAQGKKEVAVKYGTSTGGSCGVTIDTVKSGEKKKETGTEILDKNMLQDFLTIEVPLMIEKSAASGLSAKLDITFVEVESETAQVGTSKPVIRVKIGGASDARKDEKALYYDIIRQPIKLEGKEEYDMIPGTLTLSDDFSFEIQEPEEEGSTKMVKKTIYPKGRALVPRLVIKAEYKEVFKDASGSVVELPKDPKEKAALAQKQVNLITGIYSGELTRTKSLSSKLEKVITEANENIANAASKANENGDKPEM